MVDRAMKRSWLPPTLLLLVAGACAPPPVAAPPPASPQVQIAPAVGPAPGSPRAGSVSVAAVLPPAKLAIDGDLAEWGSLLPPPDAKTSGPPPEERAPSGREPPEPLLSGPNPRDAGSRVAIALTGDALLIAAELGGEARDGIWLGLGSPAPELPPIGEFGRGGYIDPPDCEQEVVQDSDGNAVMRPKPPELVATCKALMEGYEELVKTHRQRFWRTFRVDREGARLLGEGGALSRIEGARAAFKPGPRGATVEISLPLAAMPRLTAAPLEWLRLVARPATAPEPPELPPEQGVWVNLPAPVSFEPHGELRARVFEALRGKTFYPAGLSYQPGDASHVQSVDQGSGMVVELRDEALYRKEASLGDVEVGRVSAYVGFTAVLRKGKLVSLIPDERDERPDQARNRELRGVVVRDGAVHLVWFEPEDHSWNSGWLEAGWSVLAIAADGSHRDDLVGDAGGRSPRWDSMSTFASADLESFGMRGSTVYPDGMSKAALKKPVGLEITWSWDRDRKMYVGKRTSIPVPPKPKKK